MSVSLSGPIGPHSGYGVDGRGGDYNTKPAPRVRPEAQHIATQHQGSVGNLFELQGTRIGISQYRPKSAPKDHMKANARRMRQIQRASKQREEESNKPVKAMWKSTKYDTVQSKVGEELKKEPPAPRPSSANYLRAHSRTGSVDGSRGIRTPSPAPSRPCSRTSSVERLDIPRAESAMDVKLIRRDVDFVKANGRAVRKPQIKRAPSLTALDDLKKKKEEDEKNYKRGVMPKYLVNRHKEWDRAEQERIANMPDPDCPPGHHKMPDEERKKTLSLLRDKEKSYMQQLSALPVRTDTLRVRTRKDELDKKLTEIEEAIKVFNRPKVFVKD
ncbi:unnamed protein product [Owenia fusiformis]|uniref:Uncharacterized protein n=1 Tax=Owenia fusiformis TaxID=6347 RepID=A0A8J1U5A2_OWEFU|nr:unnamed protein product [Owenia fusiformis]